MLVHIDVVCVMNLNELAQTHYHSVDHIPAPPGGHHTAPLLHRDCPPSHNAPCDVTLAALQSVGCMAQSRMAAASQVQAKRGWEKKRYVLNVYI